MSAGLSQFWSLYAFGWTRPSRQPCKSVPETGRCSAKILTLPVVDHPRPPRTACRHASSRSLPSLFHLRRSFWSDRLVRVAPASTSALTKSDITVSHSMVTSYFPGRVMRTKLFCGKLRASALKTLHHPRPQLPQHMTRAGRPGLHLPQSALPRVRACGYDCCNSRHHNADHNSFYASACTMSTGSTPSSSSVIPRARF